MSDLYNRLAQKASEMGMTPSALCTKAGVTRSRMIDQAAAKINNTPAPLTVLPGKPESQTEPEAKSETTAS